MSEKTKRRIKIKFIVFFAILFLLSGLAFIVIRVFRVEKVTVEGNELYEDSAIERLVLDSKYSWNSLYVYFRFHFGKKEAVPFVDTMDVSLKSPKEVVVTVYEKGLIGYALRETDQNYIYFDKDGFVIDISDAPSNAVPEIIGVNAYGADVYDKLEIPEKTLRCLLTLTQDLTKHSLSCDSIEFTENKNVILTLGETKADLGKAENLTEKVSRIAEILPKLPERRGTLDLSTWTEETTDIVFTKE